MLDWTSQFGCLSTYLGLVELGGGGGATLRSEDDAADTDDELDEDDEEEEEEDEPELDSFFRGRRISWKLTHRWQSP